MAKQSRLSILELLDMPNPDVNRLIDTFVDLYNKAYGQSGLDHWDVSKDDWQRYEFLGDRVINLIVAQILFTRSDAVLDEGEMTKISSSVISNESLSVLAMKIAPQGFARLIPAPIAEQNGYGKRITGGAFEAFIGALYCEVGLDDVAYFLDVVMAEPIRTYNPDENAIGLLQEYFQKKGSALPEYREIAHTGPDHKPSFTYEVFHDNEPLGEGRGGSIQEAQQQAAKEALIKLGLKHSVPDQ